MIDQQEVEQIPITLRLNKNVAQVGRLMAKHCDEDFDKFISEEVTKVIFALAESASTKLEPPLMSNELKQEVQKLKLMEQQQLGQQQGQQQLGQQQLGQQLEQQQLGQQQLEQEEERKRKRKRRKRG
jgi:hypothetical protein